MGDQHDERERAATGGGPMVPDATGKTAGSNTQSQGGISHKVVQAAREEFDAAAGVPGARSREIDPPPTSLDQGGGERPADGRAHHGLSGDDAGHLASGSRATPPMRSPGAAADLGAQQDLRMHAAPRDPAERTTGADSPNRGGSAGSPGGPARLAPSHLPGQEPDEGVIQGGQSGNDAQRDQQI